MNVNKKFDRFKQWGRERMGGDVATTTTDDFRALEAEMELRHQGMERLQQSTNAYVKSLSRRDQGEGKEKSVAIAHFGASMVAHGDDFEPESEFGQCLLGLGRANERMARMQETYCANATSSWLESVERSMIQMKEYSGARKKLDQRRLAYDTASAKMQKSKREDFKMEEELRSQKQKYEESNEDVFRRMLDIKEAEADSVADLTSFLEAQLAYYDRCRDVLLQLKRDWPATVSATPRSSSPAGSIQHRAARSRAGSTTDRLAHLMSDEYSELGPGRPGAIRARTVSGPSSPRRELPGFELPVRPSLSRNDSGVDKPSISGRSASITSLSRPGLGRVTTEPQHYSSNGAHRHDDRGDVFGDDHSDHSASEISHVSSWSATGQDGSTTARKPPPPPPPPSRSKKPAPPPPPMKRSALSTSQVPQY